MHHGDTEITEKLFPTDCFAAWKIVKAMPFILIAALILGQAPTIRGSNSRWRPATYRGLTIGKSKRAEMLRVFGQPKWSRLSRAEAETESRRETWNNYERIGEFPGISMVVVHNRSRIITRIDFYPEKLSKAEAIAHFGPRYIITRYAFDSCGADEESEPIYESPAGPLVSLEYRTRGIAISIGYNDLVTKISYVGGPIGSAKSRCNKATRI